MADERVGRGRAGEAVACRHLLANGYRILERNVRFPYGEIDLVAREGGCLVFVEVRTRVGLRQGWPEESVTPRKRARLVRLAQGYLQKNPDCLKRSGVRFDVVSVLLAPDGAPARVRLIRDAFEAA